MTEEQIEKLLKYISERKQYHSTIQQRTKDISYHVGAVSELLEVEHYILKKLLDK